MGFSQEKPHGLVTPSPWCYPMMNICMALPWGHSTLAREANFRKKPNQTVNDGVAHSKNPRKCAYHMTFDLDLDLEHTLDAS